MKRVETVSSEMVKKEILKQLDRLPPEFQRRVLDFTQALALSVPKGVSGKKLLRFAGILTPEEAQTMKKAIEAGCEQADINEW
ncbi:MAG: hypothetical protein AB1426_12145 [Bacillota bacterium]